MALAAGGALVLLAGAVVVGIQSRNTTFDQAREVSDAMFADQNQIEDTAEYFGTKTWSQQLDEMDGAAERDRARPEAAESVDAIVAVQDPDTPPDVLDDIISDAIYKGDHNILIRAARTTSLPADLLDRIYRSSHRLEDRNRDAVLMSLVSNPTTSDDTLVLLAAHKDGKSRVARDAQERLGSPPAAG